MHLFFWDTGNGIDCYGTHRGCNEQLGNNHFLEFGQFHSKICLFLPFSIVQLLGAATRLTDRVFPTILLTC